ncbi:MAG: phospholipid-binding protein, partial [Planctomycetaceae bacterium]
MLGITALALSCAPASAHPWHRHREPTAEPETAANDAPAAMPTAAPFLLTAAPRPARGVAPDLAAAFAPFEKLKAVATRRDDRWFYVESNGMPDHPLMVGIRAWQQQVPLPQSYTGG